MLKNVFLNKMYLPLKNSLVAIQSSNINEVIRSVLNFFSREDFTSTEKHKTLRQFSFLTGPTIVCFVRM